MRRWLVTVAILGVGTLGGGVPAFADSSQALRPNPHSRGINGALHSGQCVGWYSAQWSHNGGGVSAQTQAPVAATTTPSRLHGRFRNLT